MNADLVITDEMRSAINAEAPIEAVYESYLAKRAQLHAGYFLALMRRGNRLYSGGVPRHVIARRRRLNKAARLARRVNR